MLCSTPDSRPIRRGRYLTGSALTRRDDKQVTAPAVSISRVDGDGLITEFRVFDDPAPVFAP